MGSWMLVTGLASLFAGGLSGMIPEPTRTTSPPTPRTRSRSRSLALGAASLAVGVMLVVLIPFLRKLITEKAETPLVETATACRAVA
jgi:proton-dependent oligopeptide transporter, POT family